MSSDTRILVFTGDGKGKTTAAVGMALRAAGHGLRTMIIQFVKNSPSGELNAVRTIKEIDIVQTGLGFLPDKDDVKFTEHKIAAEKGLSLAAEKMTSPAYQMLVLDEVCFAVSRGLLSEHDVLEVLKKAASKTYIVLTGRSATPGIIELADTVTEMRPVKHPLQSGTDAEKGIEY